MALVTYYVNTASTAGGDGTTNATTGANRAFYRLFDAEAALQADLVTATNVYQIICDNAGGNDTTSAIFAGWTTNATYYVIIKSASTCRATGVPGAGYKLVASGAGSALDVRQDGTVVDGMEFENTVSGANRALFLPFASTGRMVKNCIAHCVVGSGTGRAFEITTGDPVFMNCLAFDSAVGYYLSASSVTRGENLNAQDCTTGFIKSASGGSSFPVLKNCTAFGATTPYDNGGSASYWDQTNSTDNATDAAVTTDVPGVNPIANIVSADYTNQAANVWSIPNTSAMYATGTDLSAAWSARDRTHYTVALDDITETIRTNWSVSAWDGPAAASGFAGKVLGVANASIGKVMGVAKANIAKVGGSAG